MNTIKDLQLTENDFKMLVDALENLPNKNMAGNMMGMLLEGIIPEGEKRDEAIRMRKEKELREEREADLLKENIRVLQGKLIQFKRYLIENRLLDEANQLLND